MGGMMAGGAGTCIACYTPTETALGYSGSLEGHIVFLMKLGVPQSEAESTAELSPMRPVDTDPDHPARYATPYAVCASCAERAGLPPPVLMAPDAKITTITTRSDRPEYDSESIH